VADPENRRERMKLGFVIITMQLSDTFLTPLPPLSPMIDGLYRDQLGLNEILVHQSAPDLGSKNLEDKRLKGPIN